jgi:hypothetical protein
MKRMVLFAVVFAIVSVTVGVALGAGGANARGAAGSEGGGQGMAQVIGTWVVQVPQPNGTTNELMKTLNPGGGLIVVRTRTALGSWEYLGRGRVADTYQTYVFDDQNQLQSRIVVRAEFVVRGDTLSGHSEFDVFNPQGTLVASGEGPFTGRRYIVERP